MDKIKVLLADDHAILRAGLKTLLNAKPDIEVIGEATNGEETVRKSQELRPDIVLMDITMPGLSGTEATRQIRKQFPETKVLALSMHEDERYLYQMLEAGASGYIPKKAADTELLSAIRATHRGECFVHSSMTALLVSSLYGNKVAGSPEITHAAAGAELSSRERDVLRLLALGHTGQQTADKLYLSVKTVETYKARLKDKLGLRGRAELVRYAIRIGLVDTQA